MSQHRRGVPRTQSSLLPASVEDYVQAHAVVRVIDAYVSGLDMVQLGFVKSRPAHTGRPSYAPQDLLGLYLYAYWNRVRSSRRLEAECKRNLELMWLMRELAPDHKTIAEFRRVNAAAFQGACAQFVQFLREAELVGGELPTVAVDGSKFKANASKKSLVDAEQAAKERKKIQRRIEEYLEQMDAADVAEEAEAQPTQERIEQALERLRKRDQKLAQAQSKLAEQQPKETDKPGRPRAGLSDPDCVMLKQASGAAVAGYNVQQAVDTRHHLIVAHELTTRANDHTSLQPAASQAQQALAAPAMVVLADTGYMNGKQAQGCEDQGIRPVVPMQQASHTGDGALFAKARFVYDEQTDTYRCPAGAVLERFKRSNTQQTDYYATSACAGCGLKSQCTHAKRREIARSWYAAAAERAHQRAQSNRRLMRLRSASVEHPFGNLKAMLAGGFLVRTMKKVKGELALAVLTYNLRRTLTLLGSAQLMQKLKASLVLSGA
jgi:transposase